MAPERPSYGLTKSASTLLLQQIAKDTAVDDMQIVSFHPGGVLTDMARRAGYDGDMGIPFDDGKFTHVHNGLSSRRLSNTNV
jgi:NAD(P)-dependent dehydrogenase (short-subunit alcohol dehydrogenase family)